MHMIKFMFFSCIRIQGNFVGSFDLLGKPITFVKNVGVGIQDFFYEPTAGLLQASPQVCMYVCMYTSSYMLFIHEVMM